MATKKTTKKPATKRTTKAAATKRKTVAKKASPRATGKKPIKTTTSSGNSVTTQRLAIYTLLSIIFTYGFASWAIDSGSLWHYAFAFASFYLFVSYGVQLLKRIINKK